jgi:hypothetical protein
MEARKCHSHSNAKQRSLKPFNFLPNSLLSLVSRLFERKILRRFNEWSIRVVHSRSHQSNRWVGHIKTNKGSHRSTGLVLFDVEKAFDIKVRCTLHKLVTLNCYLYLTKIIAFFLSGRLFHVCVNTHPIPYGATLSLSLYNFFTAYSPQSKATDVKPPLLPTTL